MERPPVQIAVIGAGAIGQRHARLCASHPESTLRAIVDPAPAAIALAGELDVPVFADIESMIAAIRPEAVIVATPTPLHESICVAAAEAGLHLLVEKPISADVPSARRIIDVAEANGVSLLVGHHRRHNPIVAAAREIIGGGELGRLLAVNMLWAVRKPDAYFTVPWRTQPGAGPVLTNLIHDIDLLRHLCGEISAVTAHVGNMGRGLAIEDTTAVLIRFETGALATVTASDAAPSPWSWDANSGENPAIRMSRANSTRFLGTQAALEFPDLRIWRHATGEEPSWNATSISEERLVTPADAYHSQLTHFCAVIRDGAAPVCSGEDGLRTLAAASAILLSASENRTIVPEQG
ncbi:Gfo/Idh/MocA family oxidoreductase [Bosea sp. UNC402CLCol]|uniref:Gfo/Idh/MocA family protein n=1 Tax=Bosea sp. UNC402CLCol TaxID=1510531 RepID=UPI00056F7800|nr:Gfo/Idh/MocA family oxidoreductase [Bosea sp. UNC402CLCol]